MATKDRARDGKKRFTRTAETAERDAAACRLRSQGRTYQQIADELGYGNRSSAHDAVARALRAIVADDAEALRQHEAARLDALYEEALAVLDRPHWAHSMGKLVLDADGKPMLDDGPTLSAIRELRNLRESYRKLFGLDASATSNVTIRQASTPANEAERQQQLDAVTAEIARRATAGQTPDAEDILTSP